MKGKSAAQPRGPGWQYLCLQHLESREPFPNIHCSPKLIRHFGASATSAQWPQPSGRDLPGTSSSTLCSALWSLVDSLQTEECVAHETNSPVWASTRTRWFQYSFCKFTSEAIQCTILNDSVIWSRSLWVASRRRSRSLRGSCWRDPAVRRPYSHQPCCICWETFRTAERRQMSAKDLGCLYWAAAECFFILNHKFSSEKRFVNS